MKSINGIVYLSEDWQLVVPKTARDQWGLKPGSALRFAVTENGKIVLSPLKKTKADLIDHLQALQGLRMRRRKHICRPRI